MNKYVDELHEENEKSIHHEDMVSGTEKPVETKQKGQPTPPLPSFSKIFVPIDQQKWNDIPSVHCVKKKSVSYRISKTMTPKLCHQGFYRAEDGAMDWHTSLPFVMSRPQEHLGMVESGMIGSSS